MSLTRKVLIAVIGLMLLLSALPLSAAFEAHMVDVRAGVSYTPVIIKTMRLATDAEAASVGNPPNPPGMSSPDCVPLKTRITWVVTICVINTYDYLMRDVVVKDRFGAELAVQLLEENPDVEVGNVTHKCAKQYGDRTFVTQYRIDWDVGYIGPDECVSLDLLVWTKYNPKGQCEGCEESGGLIPDGCGKWQEYTSAGSYQLNSGAVVKWRDQYGKQHSESSMPLEVTANKNCISP